MSSQPPATEDTAATGLIDQHIRDIGASAK